MKRTCRVLAINGSHRSEKGFTQIVLDRFLEGAESARAHPEVLYPSREKITPCSACGKCMFETPGECMFHDAMETIIPKMQEADILVFACPVYFDSLPSNMQKMIERLRVTLDARFEFRNGRTYHLKRDGTPKTVVNLLTAGNPERESFTSTSRVLARIIDNMGWTPAGTVAFPASHLLATEPERLAEQLNAVAMCGREIVSKGEINAETLQAANRQYIDSPKEMVQDMTRMIVRMREENRARP
ncbi:flavodoxin family protein [Salidesulfovibrio onnuriiensis]|uniref:flavodoxin family protein n=1 Tax=Salidesulfovibrio onnuriiensis TaxID=2583823 RepID=UPI0011C709DB|nr:flavodoxin family protein [Salidesulfovibrio onnuriiensis]